MEFMLPAPLGAQANVLAKIPVRKPPDISKVETAPNAGKARADMHNATSQGDPVQDGLVQSTRELDDDIGPDTLAGPPPSFQVNVLEMDQKLQQKLAVIESERAHGTFAEIAHDEAAVDDNTGAQRQLARTPEVGGD